MVTFTEEILNGKLHFLCTVSLISLTQVNQVLWKEFICPPPNILEPQAQSKSRHGKSNKLIRFKNVSFTDTGKCRSEKNVFTHILRIIVS